MHCGGQRIFIRSEVQADAMQITVANMLGEVWGLAVNAGAMALFQRDLKRCVQTFRDRRGIKIT